MAANSKTNNMFDLTLEASVIFKEWHVVLVYHIVL